MTKIPGLFQSHTAFSGPYSSFVGKTEAWPFSRSLHCPSGLLRVKPGLGSPKAKAEMPWHPWSIRPNYTSNRGGFPNRSQPTSSPHSPGMSRASAQLLTLSLHCFCLDLLFVSSVTLILSKFYHYLNACPNGIYSWGFSDHPKMTSPTSNYTEQSPITHPWDWQ